MFDTLLRIRFFVAVYEERSFTGAASREHATQSGMTQHIQKLEEYLGVMLFVRGSGSVKPTPAGDRYYKSCLEVLRAHAHARTSARAFAEGLDGEVLVGLTPTLTRAVLAPAMSRFVAEHPNVVLRVTDAYSDIVVNKVLAGELDFAIVPGAQTQVGLRSTLFARTPEVLVCGARSGHKLVPGQGVRLADLGPIKLVLPSEAQTRRAALDSYLAAVGAEVERKLELDTTLGAIDFIASSDWMLIRPAIMTLHDLDRHLFLINPLVDPPLMLDLFRIERASEPLSPAARAFLEVLGQQTSIMADNADALIQMACSGPSRAACREFR